MRMLPRSLPYGAELIAPKSAMPGGAQRREPREMRGETADMKTLSRGATPSDATATSQRRLTDYRS